VITEEDTGGHFEQYLPYFLVGERVFVIGAQALLLVLIHLYAEKANLLGDWAYYLLPTAMPLSVTLKRS
jgi:hypothetical protein